ncbi:HTH_XRE domain containing protein [uncultured Caudovirales phage]|uniref:HTH_XRE domain containing protein n=1 Tax=uncultured Caudovirales phage TaxID=2100421 RepID=A0A6J5MTC9_9CAUD|nr:HTH_XRE domain containing protein [uncultured Caudovirales phage]
MSRNLLRSPYSREDRMLVRVALGHSVRTMRAKAGLSMRALGERANVSISHLSDVERGKSEISSEILQAIAEASNTTTENILAFAIDTMNQSK